MTLVRDANAKSASAVRVHTVARVLCRVWNVDISMSLREFPMNLHNTKWGNILALRIPAELARHLARREGDSLDDRRTVDGASSLRPAAWCRGEFAAGLDLAREAMPMGTSVIDELRRESRY